MNSIIREWKRTSRSDVFSIIPLGDIHIGAAACDETLLRQVVKRIQDDPHCYWIGMGDYADFINVKDKRFSAGTLAKWLTVKSLTDLAGAQIKRFTEIVNPIAPKCLALLCGNHETKLTEMSERDVFADIITNIKKNGGMKETDKLGLGYSGWLMLRFSAPSQGTSANTVTFTFNLHHGFVSGRLAGAKALEMQRWLWTQNADVVIFGHSHNTAIQPEAIESCDKAGVVSLVKRRGCYSGTFLRNTIEDAVTYSEMKGFLPLPLGGVEITLRPRAANRDDAIRISA